MSRRVVMWRAIIAACAVPLMPFAVVRAAATPTSLTVSGAASIYRGQNALFTAQITPSLDGVFISFDQSSDGTTWTLMGAHYTTGGIAQQTFEVDGSVPVGTRHVRARFDGNVDYEPSTSDSITQDVLIHQAEILSFQASAGQYVSILPDTEPVHLVAQARYGVVQLEQRHG